MNNFLKRPSSSWTLGLICILSVAVIWTLGTVMKKYLIAKDHNSDVITCLLNSTYVLQFITFAAGQAAGRRSRTNEGVEDTGVAQSQRIHLTRHPEGALQPLSKTLKVALLIFPIWMLAQMTYNSGISLTSITTSTVVASTSIIWTYVASRLFLHEQVSRRKTLGVCLCVAGNLLLIVPQLGGHLHASAQGEAPHALQGFSEQLFGTLLCAMSAMAYAGYTTMIKKWVTDDVSVVLFFACIGLYSLIIALPCSALITGGQHTFASMGARDVLLLLLTGVVDNVLGQYLWAKGVLYTSGTVATVGMSLTIPLSIVADLCEGTRVNGYQLLASATVVAGFVVIYPSEPGSRDDSSMEEPLNNVVGSHNSTDGLLLSTGSSINEAVTYNYFNG